MSRELQVARGKAFVQLLNRFLRLDAYARTAIEQLQVQMTLDGRSEMTPKEEAQATVAGDRLNGAMADVLIGMLRQVGSFAALSEEEFNELFDSVRWGDPSASRCNYFAPPSPPQVNDEIPELPPAGVVKFDFPKLT